MSEYYLAQLNIAYAKASIDSEIMADFAAQLDSVNAAAENAPGFIWRLKDDENNNATGFNAFDEENMLINMSIWESVDALKEYLYSGLHMKVFKDRKRWFQEMKSAHLVLWWVKSDTIPTIEDALEKLSYINAKGPTEFAFNLRKLYPKPA